MVEIRMRKCLLVFTEAELQSLLARDPTLWATALQRGKAVMRGLKAEERGLRPIGEILPGVLEEIGRRAKGRGRV